MSQFIQLHLLTAYPPANLNRDDLGRPKTAIIGGTERLRISSQCLKRAWRESSLFQEALGEFKGTRTQRLGVDAYEKLLAAGVGKKEAAEWAKEIAGVFGANKKEKKNDKKDKGEVTEDSDVPVELYIEQLVHVSPEERHNIDELVKKLASDKKAPQKKDLDLLRREIRAADIAMFGRMLAGDPRYNMEAAVQVAHAVTVSKSAVEYDFFTAVDDLNTGETDKGSAHLGETGFGAGVFYLYININRDLLLANLQGDEELTNKAIKALIECAVRIAPGGKQNSFASLSQASYALLEKGARQPRTLGTAFFKPVYKEDQVGEAIKRLLDHKEKLAGVYGPWADKEASFNVETGEGSLSDLLTAAVG